MKFKNLDSPPKKRKVFVVKQSFYVLIISFMLWSCSKDDAANDYQTVEKNTVFLNAMESELLSLINQHRESLKLSKLNGLTPAYSEASVHTRYMIEQGKTSHDNFDVRSKNLMNTTSAKVVLENVAAGYPSAELVLKAWLNSDLHRKNIENPSVQYMGISVQQNNTGVNYFTQIFIGK